MSQELSFSERTDEVSTSSLSDEDMDVPTQLDETILIEDSSSDSDEPVIVTKKTKTASGSKSKLQRQNATLTHKDAHQQDEPQWPEELVDRTSIKRLRNFVFTLNNYTTEQVGRLKEYAGACLSENAKFYMCFGHEVSKSGTKHLQGCVLLAKQVSFGALIKAPYPFAKSHILRMRGTPKQASDYCKKDGNFFECGTCPNTGNAKSTKGARHDILTVVQKIKDGATDKMLLEEHPIETFKFLRNIRSVQALIKPKRSQPLEVALLYGPPGAGKTHAIYEFDPDIFRMPVSKDFWMDNYQQERGVLIDDFNGEVKLTFLLQVLDKYPIQIPIKGGFVWWCPEKIFVTCNTHPCNWYDYATRQDSYAALARRFTKVLKFSATIHHADGTTTYGLPTETPPHNFFHYQKVIGHHCLDVSNNRPDKNISHDEPSEDLSEL